MRRKAKRIGRPPGRNWKPLMLSMTPERLATAEQVGPTAAKGVYALLDFARQHPSFVAKVISRREATQNGTPDA